MHRCRLRDLEVSIRCSARPRSVVGLRSGSPLGYTWLGSTLTIHLNELGLFEAVKINFA